MWRLGSKQVSRLTWFNGHLEKQTVVKRSANDQQNSSSIRIILTNITTNNNNNSNNYNAANNGTLPLCGLNVDAK